MFFVPCRVTFCGGPHHRFSVDLEYVPDASISLPARLLEIEASRPLGLNEQLRPDADQNSLLICQARTDSRVMLALLRSSANTPSRQVRRLAADSIVAVYRMHCCEIAAGQEIELRYRFVAFETSRHYVRLSLFRRRIPPKPRYRQLIDCLIGRLREPAQPIRRRSHWQSTIQI